LARIEVPGFLDWLILQARNCFCLIRAYHKANKSGRQYWAILNLWVLAYWFAFKVNRSLGFFLEGYLGGFWFCCLFGFDFKLMVLQRKGYPLQFINRNTPKGAVL
jgi:hypothetical protein